VKQKHLFQLGVLGIFICFSAAAWAGGVNGSAETQTGTLNAQNGDKDSWTFEDTEGDRAGITAAGTPASAASPQAPSPIRIMPLGDSITYGTNSTGIVGYRRPLYQLLIGAGYSVDFVGSQVDGSLLDFDRNHEGHRGWRADQIRDNITAWLNSTPADVVLLHIGTNDISQGQGATSTASEIGQILDLIDDWEEANNEVWVVLARIINRNDGRAGTTTTLNGLIQTLANTRIAAGDKIVVVNMESALNYPADLSDTVHPNDTGYGKMAAVWFAELKTLFAFLSNDHDADCDVDGTDLAALIANQGMLDITTFAVNFGKTACP
jgi:lysophospholipase L1-like esterase